MVPAITSSRLRPPFLYLGVGRSARSRKPLSSPPFICCRISRQVRRRQHL